jgi:hypothetical protein
VRIDWAWTDEREPGFIEMSGFDSEARTTDIRYRPEADIARECLLKGVEIGSRDVVLPLYPTGDLLVRCTDEEGRALTRACIAMEGDGFAGSTWKEDPRGELLVRDVPVGAGKVWVLVWERPELGPFDSLIRPGERTVLDARTEVPFATLAVHLELVDGQPLNACQVILLDDSEESVIRLVGERFLGEWDAPPRFTTGSDGRCDLPTPPGTCVVGLCSLIRIVQDSTWGTWDSPLFGLRRVVVPRTGMLDVGIRLDWNVAASRVPRESPAFAAGFRRGDTIVAWDGKTVRDVEDCVAAEEPIPVTVRRAGEVIELRLPPGSHGLVMDRHYFEAR